MTEVSGVTAYCLTRSVMEPSRSHTSSQLFHPDHYHPHSLQMRSRAQRDHLADCTNLISMPSLLENHRQTLPPEQVPSRALEMIHVDLKSAKRSDFLLYRDTMHGDNVRDDCSGQLQEVRLFTGWLRPGALCRVRCVIMATDCASKSQ